MVWRLRLEPGLTVETEAGPLGPPPNSTVAVLLVLLAARQGSFVPRAELAATLYPDASRPEASNALRQSLFRLRGWLGEGCVLAEGSGIRLAPDRWTVVPDPLRGETLETVLLAGIDHPALDRIRRAWSKPTGLSLDGTARSFVSVVSGLADHDVDAARGVFVAGGPLLTRLGNENLAELLRRTKPTNRLSPFALEHRERAALFFTRLTEFERAYAGFLDAFRLARRLGDERARMRAASYLVCLAIERGEMAEAEAWLRRLDGGASTRPNLDLLNGEACFHWNAGDTRRALATMARASLALSSADRPSRFRFWANYALLSAEAGETELSREAVARASELSSAPDTALESAKALQWAKRGEPYRGIDLLTRSLRRTRDEGNRVGTLYVEEALAELLAGVGHGREARELWRSASDKRLGRHNPRTLACHRRIESLCA